MSADLEPKAKPNEAARIAVSWLPVEALEPDPRNARLHPEGQVRRIADSIAAFGFNVPVLIDGREPRRRRPWAAARRAAPRPRAKFRPSFSTT